MQHGPYFVQHKYTILIQYLIGVLSSFLSILSAACRTPLFDFDDTRELIIASGVVTRLQYR